MGSSENLIAPRQKPKYCSCLFGRNLRRSVIFNGIMQSILQTFLIIMSSLALKIGLEMREKQELDLIDHGGYADESNDDQIPYKNVDLIRLWTAKQTNDFHIKMYTMNMIIFPIYVLSCLISIYGAVIRSRILILIHCCGFALYAFYGIGIVLYRAYFYNNELETIKYYRDEIRLQHKTDFFDNIWFVLVVGLICTIFALLTVYGILTAWYYQLQLRDEALASETCSNNVNVNVNNLVSYGTEFMKNLWPTNTIKSMLHSFKHNYCMYQSAKPTAV